MRLNTLINRVEKARGEVIAMVRSACELPSVQKWIVDANKEQLSEGVNANGVLMNGGVYSPTSVRMRARMGLPVDHVYLSYEGDMQAGMQVEYTDTGFSVVTTDWKQRLVDEAMRTGYWPSSGYNDPEYGPVFGLTEAKKGELARKIAPMVARRVRRRMVN